MDSVTSYGEERGGNEGEKEGEEEGGMRCIYGEGRRVFMGGNGERK